MSVEELIQQAINALSLGSTYALLALGLAMVFAIIGIVNFAHGELVALAAYAAYLLNSLGAPFWAQVLAALVVAPLAAVIMERLAFRPFRGRSFLTLLFTSFAVAVIIQSSLIVGVSPRQRGVPMPDWINGVWGIGPYDVSVLQVLTLVTCLGAMAILTVFLKRSKQGLGMLAASQDLQVTRLMGISADRVIAMAFAISGLLAGIAAIFILARRGTVEPTMGFVPLLKAFIAVIIGGMGSLSGAVVGGFVLGALEVGFDIFLPTSVLGFRDAFALLGVIVILYIRPQGLMSRAEVAL